MHHLASLLSIFSSSSNVLRIVSNNTRMHHSASLLLNFSQQFQLPKNRFKQPHNAHFLSPSFQIVSAVPNSRTSFQIESECTIYRPWFQNKLQLQLQNIFFPYTVRMHHLLPLILNIFSSFSTSKNISFKMRKHAPFRDLSFKTFSAAPTLVIRQCFIYCHLWTPIIVL